MAVDLVLGVSMTSAALRWVLVEGTTGEGPTIGRGTFGLAEPADLMDVLPADEPDTRLHAIGLTWTDEADDAASGVLDALRAKGLDNVIAVSELEAGEVLASGIAGIAEYEEVAVCIVEPDSAVVAIIDAGDVAVDRLDRPSDGSDVVELPSSVIAMLELDDWNPDSIFVVGSADDLDLIKSTLEAVTDAPVFSATEADLALARGAALASARAVNGLETTGSRRPSRVLALTAVVAAAAVTLVVSLSVGLGMSLSADAPAEQTQATTADSAPPPPSTQSVKKVAKLTESLKAARPVVAQTIVVAAPPAAPAYEPPAAAANEPPAAAANEPPAAAPPMPTYAPPPVYVPPVAPQPRLRDRILERIPIINRFHEPEYQYPN